MAAGVLLAACWYAGRRDAWAQTPSQRGVWEIRFGLVEPPVVAQKDVTVRAPTSNQQAEPKPLECSGLAWAAGRLLMTSDRHEHVVFSSRVDPKQLTIQPPTPHVIIRNEHNLLDDAESITLRAQGPGAWRAYVMCSLSNDRTEQPLPKRRHLVRFTVRGGDKLTFEGLAVLDAGPIRQALNAHFKALGIRPYRTFWVGFSERDKNTYRWGNVEGIAHTPDGKRLLCGMRNPLLAGRALVFAVAGVDEAFDAKDAARLRVTDLFALDLGRRGISDLAWDPVTKGYLITAAKSNGPKLDKDQPFPPNTLDSALFWWSGHKKDRPVLVARLPDMKVEAVCRPRPSSIVELKVSESLFTSGSCASS